MLSALSIRDIVLIESLDLEFRSGLTALTGETGAGKSILLDALTLALGGRGDAGLVRQGCVQGQVTAVFDVGRGHPVWGVMEESGIDADGDIVLRRVQNADGRSRAFVNDRPTSVQLLRDVGAQLVEIHGQHDDRALVDTAFHLALLDAFAENGEPLEETARLYTSWRGAEKAVADAVKTLEEARQEEGFLRHAVAELERLNPHAGEEEALAVRRQTMMAAEKLASDLNEVASAVSGEDAPDARLAAILRKLERRREEAPELLGGLLDAMSAALDVLDGVRLSAEEALREAAFDPSELEATEERLFSLRAASRKYGVQTDGLSALADKMRGELDLIDAGEGISGGKRKPKQRPHARLMVKRRPDFRRHGPLPLRRSTRRSTVNSPLFGSTRRAFSPISANWGSRRLALRAGTASSSMCKPIRVHGLGRC